jgi:predicted RNA-binding Zn-ribbon protein involved in translation (DUF1610 family)
MSDLDREFRALYAEVAEGGWSSVYNILNKEGDLGNRKGLADFPDDEQLDEIEEDLVSLAGEAAETLARVRAARGKATRMVCPHCGSAEVQRDASAEWNGTDWVLCGLQDDISCENCGVDGITCVEKPV